MNEEIKKSEDEAERESSQLEQPDPSQEEYSANPSIGSIGDILSAKSAMNSILPAIHNADMLSSSLSAAMKPIIDAQKAWAINALPLISPSLQSYSQSIAGSVIQNYAPISDAMKSLTSSLKDVLLNYTFQLPQIAPPILEMFKGISQTYFESISESLKVIDFSRYRSHLSHLILRETFDSKWVPNTVWDADPELLMEVLSIVRSTKKSKNRVKMIDRAILNYYSKRRIESIKKSWRGKGLPEHSMRMMHQAVQAYHRKEYALTIVMLSTMWEGIIYEKAHDTHRKIGKWTKNNFEKLIEQNELDELFQSFFDEYIMYDCTSAEQVKEDVPGRNSSAHSWYNKYPSRKAALNAILFTDLLLKLEPIVDETEEIENANA